MGYPPWSDGVPSSWAARRINNALGEDTSKFLGAMFATKRPQDGPRAAQDAAQEASRKHLEGVLEPGAAQEEGTPSDQGGYPIVPFSIWLHFGYILDDFSSFLAYFGHVFGCSCGGGYDPQTPRS